MYRNLFFDLDGTLLNTAPGIMWSLHKTFEEMKLPDLSDEQLRAFIGPPLFESYERYCGLTGEENQRAVKTYQKYFNEQGGREMYSFYDGMEVLLQQLSDARDEMGNRRYRLFVATTKPEDIARKILTEIGYAPYFEFIGGAMQDNQGSQKVDVIKRVLRESGLVKESVAAGEAPYESDAARQVIDASLMIGDRYYDVRGAHLIGMKAVGALWGFGSEEEFAAWETDYLIARPEGLLPIIGERLCS